MTSWITTLEELVESKTPELEEQLGEELDESGNREEDLRKLALLKMQKVKTAQTFLDEVKEAFMKLLAPLIVKAHVTSAFA